MSEPLDLEAIKQRQAEGVRGIDYGHAGKILASLEDIPALLSRVAELEAENAAAPDLLEACQDFVSKLDDFFAGKINIRPDYADRARAAIAKATKEG